MECHFGNFTYGDSLIENNLRLIPWFCTEPFPMWSQQYEFNVKEII